MSDKYEYKKRFYDLEKEEQFLNEMSEKGLAMKEIKWGFFKDTYRFEPSNKKYVYREDYNPDMPVLEEITSPYVMFVTGTYKAEYVCWANGKVYFRKAADSGEFPPIYTSLDSRIAAEKKQLWRTLPVLLLFLFDFLFIVSDVVGEGDLGRLSFILIFISNIGLLYCLLMSCRHVRKIFELKKRTEKSEGSGYEQ
ncbi:MAG: DUF2812 domain-containing protein [Oscillospiraceae bacterium]|nr:DUF2812 domain-containing protein [Oscillospiraceae bacterium]